MAFSSSVKKTTVIGDVRLVMGTYTNGAGDTGGDIATGLKQIFYFNSDCETSQAATVNLVSISGGTVTLTTVANEDGRWIAIGV